VRALLAKGSAANILAQKAARSAASDVNYGQALREGAGKTNTPAINKVLAQPDIAEIRDGLLQSRPLQGEAPNSPKVLDAIYKVLSDRAGQLKRGLESPTPNKPNLGRFNQEDVAQAKSALLDAMSGAPATPGAQSQGASSMVAYRPMSQPWPGQTSGSVARGPGSIVQALNQMQQQGLARVAVQPSAIATAPMPAAPMPSMRNAIAAHAEASGNIDATRRGQDILRSALGKAIPSGKNLDRTTPDAFAEWAAKRASPDNISHAAEGILGATKQDLFKHPLKNMIGGRAVGAAPGLLRDAGSQQQQLIDLLTNAGLLSGNAGSGAP
jgi:hypothetical protein